MTRTEHMLANRSKLPASVALALGAVLVLVAFLLAELVTSPSRGHRIDTSNWPIEAQRILGETPGSPVSPEQWKRIDRLLRKHGDMNYGQRPYWAQTVRASWWWFITLPLFATLVYSVRRGRVPFSSVTLLVAPSAATLLLALTLVNQPR